ncbi:ABC transporter substrate-binding protein [Falsiroseomonas sp. HW251]|uniref:ABC transporter substrate-binding protein n=1 Tax=Falsiroseomonas sp. HW251 TaxID=3390998 RepID=UPI003D31DD28
MASSTLPRRKLALGAALTLAAPAVQAQSPVTITFRFNDPEAPQMRAALDEFERANPSIRVTMQRVSWADAQQQFLREAAVGGTPDVAQLAFVWPRSFAAAGALRPLDDFVRRGIGLQGWDDFLSRDLALGADSKIYAVPWTTDTFAMYYNKDLLAQAGITSFPTDWEGLRAASQGAQQRTGKPGWAFPAGSCGTPSVWFFLNYFWWSKGPGLIDRDGDTRFRISMTAADIQEGLEYYDRYLREGHNPRSSLSICLWGAPEVVEGLVSGDIAIASLPDPVAIDVATKWRQRNGDRPVPFASAPHPAGPNGSRTHLGGRMLGIGAASRRPEEAWRLIEFLCRPEPTFTRHYTNYTLAQIAALPMRNWTPDLMGFPAQLRTARSWGAYNAGPVPIPFMWNATGRAAGSVFIGEKTAAQAARELHEAITREFARNQR